MGAALAARSFIHRLGVTLGAFLRHWLHDRHWGWRLARVVSLCLIGLYGYLMFAENHFIFYPDRYPLGNWQRAEPPQADGQMGTRIEDCYFPNADGLRLHGWLIHPVQRRGQELQDLPVTWTILLCHGNAGNVTNCYEHARRLTLLPAAVLVFDYRGYGRSEGRPNEAGVYRDATAAWEYLTTTRRTPAGRTVVLGYSLGGAVAVELAGRVPAAGLILESTFTSVPDMAKTVLPIMPRFLVRTQMNSLRRIPHLKLPKLLFHGTADEVVPFSHGERLFAAAAEPKQFVPVPGATHENLAAVAGELYDRSLRDFLARLPPTPAGTAGPP